MANAERRPPRPTKPKTTTTPKVVTSPPPVLPPVPPPPPPPTKDTLGDPTGTIGGPLKIAYGRGAPWADVNRYDDLFIQAGEKHGVPPAMLKAMAVIESGGQMIANQGGSGAYGIMQIKPDIWGSRAKKLGYDLRTPAGQIGMAAAMLGGDVPGVSGSTPKERFLNNYYPTAGLDVPGEDGHTPRQYLADMDELMRQIRAAGGAGAPPDAQPVGDVIDLLYGGKPYDISAGYGQLVTWSCPGCYEYFTAYGLDSQHHWAYDVSANAGDGAPLYAPFDGKVVCGGTANGPGAWGTGCAAFARNNNYGGPPSGQGSGRLELLSEDGERSLIIGHALSSRVSPGARVHRGDLIGQQGGMNGSHVHLEGRYANGKQIGDPRKLFGGGPIPAERLPYLFDLTAHPNMFNVRALKDLTIYQRADPTAQVLDVLKAGETFQAVAIVPGNDQKMWYLGIYNGRVPMTDTELVE